MKFSEFLSLVKSTVKKRGWKNKEHQQDPARPLRVTRQEGELPTGPETETTGSEREPDLQCP